MSVDEFSEVLLIYVYPVVGKGGVVMVVDLFHPSYHPFFLF